MDNKPIQDETKALQILVDEIQKAKDDDTREMLLAEINKSASKLQELCDAIDAEAKANETPEEDKERVVVEVVLTPEQRQRVLDKTGVDVPSIKIPDSSGKLTESMQQIEPDFIEECATRQAETFLQLVADADSDPEIPEEDITEDEQEESTPE